ncbi:unnamed protein product [Rotaria magnacalcarata]|uniref:Uncharacterized protein n=1 Tax=Rotaria magnacalcarata TaxID=392030 RepID=A0A816H6V8_9BILA|nr:unnamed protein product [Rotaria magnacalcarata]CAF1683863.1 unnamed protein product [Rotaria magnacalcarata]CAF4042758.1 unnamed protein product [Rotaria magnacalcarata]CAF5114752.1 unnamed protein product [Rotaria magnacalcarata]
MGNTCTSAKTDSTIQKSVKPSDTTTCQLPPVENSTAMKTITEEDPSPPKNTSEEAPSPPKNTSEEAPSPPKNASEEAASASPVELQLSETSSTKHGQETE